MSSLFVLLVGCSGYNYDGISNTSSSIASSTVRLSSAFIKDPHLGNNDGGSASSRRGWGEEILELPNGNIVLVDGLDDTGGGDAGAVHLFKGTTLERIQSFYGDNTNDWIGVGIQYETSGVTVLDNGNFIIHSAVDDVAGISEAGSVTLVNGSTGNVITTLAGNNTNDKLGNSGSYGVSGILKLKDNHFAILSALDDVGGVVDAGSVTIIDGSTGQVIATLAGNNSYDYFGYIGQKISGVTQLENGNIIVASPYDDVGGLTDAGSVTLYSSTGTLIATISGDQNGDFLTGTDQMGVNGITHLDNGNFVIVSSFDNNSTETEAGSVKLVNGTTGVVIATLAGDNSGDRLGYLPCRVTDVVSGQPVCEDAVSGITELDNGNIVVESPLDDVTVTDAGSVTLINGTTGAVVATFTGNNASDQLSYSGVFGISGIKEFSNGHFSIASALDDISGIANAGSVIFVNSSTGAEVGRVNGNSISEFLGLPSFVSVTNTYTSQTDKVAVASQIQQLGSTDQILVSCPNDNIGVLTNAGSVFVYDISSASVVATHQGDGASDQLGYSGEAGTSGITVLSNGNYLIESAIDDVGGITDSGSVKLIDGSSHAVIATLAGTNAQDRLGDSGAEKIPGIIALSNGNFVIHSRYDDTGGTNAGSVKLVDGDTGAVIQSYTGDSTNDNLGFTANGVAGVITLSNGNIIIHSPLDDVSSLTDAGSLKLINGTTGAEITSISGQSAGDKLGYHGLTNTKGIIELNSTSFAIRSPLADASGVTDGGSVKVINSSSGSVLGSFTGRSSSDKTGYGGLQLLSNGGLLILNPYWDYVDDSDPANTTTYTDSGSVYFLSLE